MSDLTPGRPDLAVATVLGPPPLPRPRVIVGLEHAESSNRIPAAFGACDRIPAIGDLVDAVDPVAGREATAEVVGIDEQERLIRIAVDWLTVHDAEAGA